MSPIAFGFSGSDGDAGLCRNGVRAARARLHRGVLQRSRQGRLIRLYSAVSVSTNGLAIIAVLSCFIDVKVVANYCCFQLTFAFSDAEHNPALKYAPNGDKISLPLKAAGAHAHSAAGGAAAAMAAAAANSSSVYDRSYPPPDVAIARIFRARDDSPFAQVCVLPFLITAHSVFMTHVITG